MDFTLRPFASFDDPGACSGFSEFVDDADSHAYTEDARHHPTNAESEGEKGTPGIESSIGEARSVDQTRTSEQRAPVLSVVRPMPTDECFSDGFSWTKEDGFPAPAEHSSSGIGLSGEHIGEAFPGISVKGTTTTHAANDIYDKFTGIGVEAAIVEEIADEEARSNEVQSISADPGLNSEDFSGRSKVPPNKVQPLVVALPQSTLTQPRSLYTGYSPLASETSERNALDTLLRVIKKEVSSPEFIELLLTDFCVYISSAIYPNELRPLQHLAVRQASDQFYFDGILQYQDVRVFVKRVPFRELPIGNYGITEHTVDQIWIRSNHNRDSEIFYKLERPSVEYKRFYTPFLWIANLTKHVVDYCDHLREHRRRATLNDFRSRFDVFIWNKHGKFAAFQEWHACCGTDFRSAIVANVDFIWKEAVGVLGLRDVIWHQFWREIKGDWYGRSSARSISFEADDLSEGNEVPPTIVTPYMFDLFAHMGFGRMLKAIRPSVATKKARSEVNNFIIPWRQSVAYRNILGDRGVVGQKLSSCRSDHMDHSTLVASIQPGDVISTPPDGDNTNSKWKTEISDHYKSEQVWYGLVQKVHVSKPRSISASQTQRSFDVIWLYQPRDTPCALMKYPWKKELFLSDTCTCGGPRINEDEVLDKHQIEWFGDPDSSLAEFAVRQTYCADRRHWATLKEGDLMCEHYRQREFEDHHQSSELYRPGDTVLADIGQEQLQVFIMEALSEQSGREVATLRRLLRRNETYAPDCPPNELVYSEQLVDVKTARLARKCLVRCFKVDEKIPSPYDRNGTGDAFIIRYREITEGNISRCIPLEESLDFRQGFNPFRIPRSAKLRGLDLFCGGGNFGRGLEDGGGIEMLWANDISSNALHTYMANCKPEACTPFLGSVDDLLYGALTGAPNVPAPGEVQFISGGSPCQGFSRLTSDKTTDRQRKNQSLIASFASFIDVYRPCYGVLENVKAIVQAEENRKACFFSQLICAIVGLGYQVQIVMMDAWSYGAPQSRERVFLLFSAPGLTMPKVPAPTHSHPPGTRFGTIGKMSNGEPYAKRLNVLTPFKFVSAYEATIDLPNIQDGKADYCVGFPDHRLTIGFTPTLQRQLAQIPTHPWGMSYSKMIPRYDQHGNHMSGITKEDHAHFFPQARSTKARFKGNSHSLGRVEPNGLFRTVTTSCAVVDARTGYVNHWQQPRPLTVLEARRAQGFLDHELILGNPPKQWHIVGNSVARQVALALGLAFREAWLGTMYEDEDEKPEHVRVPDLEILKVKEEDVRVPVQDEVELDEMVISGPGTNSSTSRDVSEDTPIASVSTPITSNSDGSRSMSQKRHWASSDVDLATKRLRMDGD